MECMGPKPTVQASCASECLKSINIALRKYTYAIPHRFYTSYRLSCYVAHYLAETAKRKRRPIEACIPSYIDCIEAPVRPLKTHESASPHHHDQNTTRRIYIKRSCSLEILKTARNSRRVSFQVSDNPRPKHLRDRRQ